LHQEANIEIFTNALSNDGLVRRRFFSQLDLMLCSVTANAVTGFGLGFLPQAVASSPSVMQGCVAINHAQLRSCLHIVMMKNIYIYFVHSLTIRVHKAGAVLLQHY
jgi:hypothetical protein